MSEQRRKLKVGIDVSEAFFEGYGGVILYAKEIIKSFIGSDEFDIFLFSFKNIPLNEMKKLSDVSVYISPIHIETLWDLIILPVQIKIKRIDVFLSLTHNGPFFVPSSTRYICVIHDVAYRFFPQSFKLRERFFHNLGIKRALRISDQVIVDSKNTKNDLITLYNYPEEKITPIYLGIKKNVQIFKLREKQEVLKKFGISDRFMLFVGNISPRKNLSKVIEAYKKLPKDLGYQLVIVGARGYKADSEIKKNATENADIIILHAVNSFEMEVIYRAASLLVFMSLYEGFGLPLLEAMACGTPVLTSNVSSMPEVAKDAALYVEDPNDSSEISLKMQYILRDKKLQSKLISNGYKRVKDFSWKKCAHEATQVINNVYRNNE
ncbi:glycosyltransferase family 4 protein [Patescibacteria group bacterium]|nr:glycosyltransferase family 4 protein [Patescibacteria group bacterium]